MTCRINPWFEQRRSRSSIHKCISLHSQFVHLNSSIEAISELYTFDHRIVQSWRKQTSAEKLFQHTPIVCWTWSSSDIWKDHDQTRSIRWLYQVLRWSYDVSFINDKEITILVTNSQYKIHYKCSQLLKLSVTKHYQSFNLYLVIIQRHLLGSYR